MSTFDGLVDEFPEIRIDHFRTHTGRRPPAACFLSHVHSDHLLGLETLKMPFVYCSAVTRNILLRMEKYPHRINFQKGILESRRQTYRHLKSILRALPLEAPIELELRPHSAIRVTLFDANHCPGAVMFLIEGDGKAILYTGDIRAEHWWVNSIVQNPVLLPYTCGLKYLDCVYLDTTFATHDNIHKHFPTKADGLKELLSKIDDCPPNSTFYFRSWTLGYEDVWLALANYLCCRIHVDDYQLRLYSSCAEDGVKQAAALIGIQVGNSIQPGCLSNDATSVVHSCEPGMECHARLKKASHVVWITPIISRSDDGTELAEVGAGGGFGDLHQVSRLEFVDHASIQALRTFCNSTFSNEHTVQQIETIIKASDMTNTLNIPLDGLGLDPDEEVTLKHFVDLLSRRNTSLKKGSDSTGDETGTSQRVIRFPYSRHSSLSELRDLLSRFEPKDICPCTVDVESWTEDVSIRSLFGDLCSQEIFKHDVATRTLVALHRPDTGGRTSHRKRKREPYDSQETVSQDSLDLPCNPPNVEDGSVELGSFIHGTAMNTDVIIIDNDSGDESDKNPRPDEVPERHLMESMSDISLPYEAFDSQDSTKHNLKAVDRGEKLSARRRAYRAAKSCLSDDQTSTWDDLRLRSLGWKGHTEEETIL